MMFAQEANSSDPPRPPTRSCDLTLPLNCNKMEHSNDGHDGCAPSLISLMAMRERCLKNPYTTQHEETRPSNAVDTSDLLAVLDDILDTAGSSSHPQTQFQNSPDSASRRTMGRLNSMVPVRKPERQPSSENLTRSDGPRTPAHESSVNAVFDLITPTKRQSTTTHLNPSVIHRATSIPGDIALCKPKRKSSSDNLIKLHKRRQERHSCDSLVRTRFLR